MPSSADIRAGAAYVELSVNNSALVRGLKAAQRRLKGFSASVTAVGKRMMLMSGMMAMPFVGGVKVYADFEQQMANVSTMLSEPEKHMPGFRDSIRDMSVEFGEGTESLAKGLYDILSASVPAEQALDVLATSARAAKAGLTDTGVAADAITTILNAYGLEAERAADVSDWLFTIVKRGKTTFAELAPSIGMVATTASTAGVSMDEMGAALATMTRNGVKTDNAVTALNAIISSFLKPTSEAAEYARSLGFEMSSATLESEGLVGVFKRIGQLPPDAIAKLFPNVRALRGVLPALRNMQGFGDDLAAMGGRAGATGEAYGKMTKTLTHSFNQLKQAGLSVLSVIGEALAEPVGKAAKAITRYAKMVRELIQNNKGMVLTALKVVAAVGAVGGILVAVGSSAAVLAFALGGLASIASAVGTAIGVIGSVIGALLTPIGLVSVAVVALGGYLVYASGIGGKAISWLAEHFAWLSDTARAAFKGIGDALAAGDMQLAARILWLSLKLVFQKGASSLLAIWLDLKNGILNVWISAKATLLKTWQTLWFALKEIAIKNGIAEPLLEGFHLIEFGWLKVTQAMGQMWMELVSLIFKAWNRVQSGIKSAQQWIGEIAIDVMGYFDESLDTDAAKEMLRDDYAGEQRQLDAEMAAMQDQLEADRRAMRDRHQAEDSALVDRQGERVAELKRQEAIGNQGRLAEMEQARRDVDTAAEAERSALDEKAAADLKASAQALADARSEWKSAIAEAARKRGEARDSETGKPDASRIEALIDQVRAAAPAVAGAGGRIEVQGAFNLSDLRALAAAGASDTVAANTAEMVRQQKRTNQKLDEQNDSGLAFL
jgi:TP901 family phage tail tape measure protein